jgi:hypothetical protein
MNVPAPCPKCGTELERGYGLAGGGIGPYEYCPKDGCGYFTKSQETQNPRRKETP